MKRIYYKSYQSFMKVAMKVLPWREPQLLEGENSLQKLPSLIKQQNIESALLVTDKGIVAAGLIDQLVDDLRFENIESIIFDETVANPTLENIEAAVDKYKQFDCQAIIAFGGGSVIDCAKLCGAQIAKPNKDIVNMKGLFKILKPLPAFFAVPTTAGTGAEATLAAVFSNSETKEKHPVMDTSLIPDVAVLDPLLTLRLPKNVTAETGMDALTHAIEAYIGNSNSKNTRKWSIEATELIFNNLYEAYSDGNNIRARENMQKAAFLAGKAFTRAYVGYVHAIAHQLGGFYNIPHGLANAVILPHVLDYYGEAVYKPLAQLADTIGVSRPNDSYIQKAETFISSIRDLNEKMGIPSKINGIIDDDVPTMVERALREANPLYPVPKTLFADDLSQLFYKIKEN